MVVWREGEVTLTSHRPRDAKVFSRRVKKGKGSPYSITERRVPELIPVLGSRMS